MPIQQETPVMSVVVPFEAGMPVGRHEVPKRWHAVDRSAHHPHIVAVVGDDGTEWTAAALVTARPQAAYLKIVDAVGDVRVVVAAVVDHARRQGLAQVKWEGWTVSPEDAAAAGFTALRPPLGQGVEQGEETAGPTTGYVLWLGDGTPAPPPYYGQTTHFTCGAVTALVAQTHAGQVSREALDRRAELSFWRGATNFPACEPVGLGVAVRRAWPSSSVTVHLDTDRPVLLGHLPEHEQEWRAILQRTSRTEAEQTGVPVDPDRLPMTAIRAAVERREHVLLLISLDAMLGFDVPHWVLCHGAVPGALVIDDPWANTATGDTWLDAHLLPVPDTALDMMSTHAPDSFRGAVTIASARAPHPCCDCS